MMRFVSVQDRVLATVWTVPRVPVLLTVGPWRRGVQDRIDCILEDHSYGWERRMFFSPILGDENLWSSTSSIGGFVPCGWDPSCMDLPLCSGGSHVSGSRPQQWFLLFHDGRMEIRSMDGITVPSFLPSSTPPTTPLLPFLSIRVSISFPNHGKGTRVGFTPIESHGLSSLSLTLTLTRCGCGGRKGVFPIRWMGRSFVDHNRTQTRSTIPTCAPTTRLQHQRKKTQRTTPVDVDTVRSETKGKTKQTRGRKTRI